MYNVCGLEQYQFAVGYDNATDLSQPFAIGTSNTANVLGNMHSSEAP